MNLCKGAKAWEFSSPSSRGHLRHPESTLSAQQGTIYESLPNRSPISRALQSENAVARTLVEIGDTGAGSGVSESLATRNLLCDRFVATKRGNGGSLFQYARGNHRRANERVAMHGSCSAHGGD